MKTRPSLTLLLLTLMYSSFAQKLSLCNAFPRLIENAKTKFINLKGDKLDKSHTFLETDYKSTLEIEGSDKSYVGVGVGTENSFTVEFGNYATQEEANQKMNSIKTDFLSCKPKFEFIEGKEILFKTPLYYFIENIGDEFRIYNADIETSQYNNKNYYVKIEFRTDNNPLMYQKILAPRDNSNSAKEILRLIEESKTGFKNIKGAAIDNPYSADVMYNTTFCITGAKKCGLILEGMRWNYQAFILINLSEDEYNKSMVIMIKGILAAVGSDYAITKKSDSDNILFGKITDAARSQNCALEIVKQKSKTEGKFNIILKVNEHLSIE